VPGVGLERKALAVEESLLYDSSEQPLVSFGLAQYMDVESEPKRSRFAKYPAFTEAHETDHLTNVSDMGHWSGEDRDLPSQSVGSDPRISSRCTKGTGKADFRFAKGLSVGNAGIKVDAVRGGRG